VIEGGQLAGENVAMEVRSIGFATDLALLSLGGSSVEDRGDHIVIRTPDNPSHWWGNFLLLDGIPPPDEQASWIDVFHALNPAAHHVAIGFDEVRGSVDALSGFTGAGLAAGCATVMTAAEVALPTTPDEGVVGRVLETEADWSQSVKLMIRCEDRGLEPIGYRAFVEARAATRRALVTAGHGAWFGMFVDDRLVSQLGLFRAGAKRARFQAVETDPEFRRRGLARALVRVASDYGFSTLAAEQLVMVAEPDYWAIDLYRSVGFVDTESQFQVERPGP
jgi:ribosomal protein S18 acetylase RimI-like enzyme